MNVYRSVVLLMHNKRLGTLILQIAIFGDVLKNLIPATFLRCMFTIQFTIQCVVAVYTVILMVIVDFGWSRVRSFGRMHE